MVSHGLLTRKDKIEGWVSAILFIVGLPALILAVQFATS